MIKTLKTHASLRGVSNANDAAIQLLSFKREQSASVTTLTHKRHAFTMAEILLSLTIIGVVAAITLPSLMANINERTWNTQRKALYARMSQAIAMMPQVGGYGTLTGTLNADGTQEVTADTAAEAFLTEGLSKVLKINNICDNTHLQDCGFVSKISTLSGSLRDLPTTMKELRLAMVSASYASFNTHSARSYNVLNTKAAAFETQNGESVLAFYNPNCLPKSEQSLWSNYSDMFFTQPYLCANFVYDLNGNKGPNMVGKDIGFISALYSDDTSVVNPVPYTRVIGPVTSAEASAACIAQAGEDYRLPNLDELSALFVNLDLIGHILDEEDIATQHWYSSFKEQSQGYDIPSLLVLTLIYGEYRTPSPYDAFGAMCIKR